MIEYIKGEIVELQPALMIMECGGVGYELNISLTTYSTFDGLREGKIYVHEVIREDAHLLYGFASREERELFLLLTSVSGVGPNTARMILSSFKPSDLIDIIASGDDATLTTVKASVTRRPSASLSTSRVRCAPWPDSTNGVLQPREGHRQTRPKRPWRHSSCWVSRKTPRKKPSRNSSRRIPTCPSNRSYAVP